eukprot:GILI01015527.1.p1 GENE.GILI01015527.1~~GILI01015527.1.p1  ORF type:complete len:578 (+),score=74.99 GILI01015527.1:36-1769(+)
MSYMREKVAPVRISPPPGTYKGPIRITMETPTPHAEILFTLDESLPVHNSDREHGYRCEHYKNYMGYELKENGEHILTIQAHKKGMVSAPLQKVKYVITHSHATERTSLPDMMIERRFQAMEQLDPPMQVRQARKRDANMQCALVDTCPKSVLREKVQNGEPLTLFKLKYDPDSAAGRNYQYARVVSPNMKMIMPQLPSSKSRANCPPSVEITMDGMRSTTPMLYNPPSSFHNMHLIDSSDATLPLNLSAINKSASQQLKAASCYPASRPPSQLAMLCREQVAIFEHRAGTDQYANAQDYFDDKDDLNDMASYQNQNTDVFNAFSMRMPPLKNTTDKVGGHAEDVASADAKSMNMMVMADSACVDGGLRAFLGMVSYAALYTKVTAVRSNDRVTIFDLLTLCGNRADQRQVTDMLKLYEANPNQHPPTYNVAKLLQLCRYVINVYHNVPEAVLGLMGMAWRDELAATNTEPSVGRLVLQGLLDHYRRAEGHNPKVYDIGRALLTSKKENGGLEFSDDAALKSKRMTGRASATQFLTKLCELCPALDKQLQLIEDNAAAMYQRPLAAAKLEPAKKRGT